MTTRKSSPTVWPHKDCGDSIGALRRSSPQLSCSHNPETRRPTASTPPPRPLTMETTSRRSRRPNDALPSLNEAINALDRARDKASLKLARDAFYSASGLLATIRVRFFPVRVCRLLADVRQDSVINEVDFVELGLGCAEICQSLDRGIMGGAPLPCPPILEAVEQLTT